jgi:hypothetical protein
MKRILLGILIGAVAAAGYNHLRAPSGAVVELEQDEEPVAEAQASAESDTAEFADTRSVATDFRCDGRTYCSQMTSCEEAMYFLENCPGVKMDGSDGEGGRGDGVPCESQWCGNR